MGRNLRRRTAVELLALRYWGSMQAILAVTVPFFALILAGYVAAQRGWLPLAAIPGLNTFVLFFALPCMLLRFCMNTPLAALLDPVISGLYIACAAVVLGLALVLGRASGAGPRDAAFSALVAAFPNSGFIGVPLLVALLGPGAAGPIICTMLVDMMLTTSACLAWAQRERHAASPSTRPAAAFLAALKAPLMNPLPWSIALGALMSGFTLQFVGPVDKAIGMLADAASPVALFTIGAVLYRSRSAPSGPARGGLLGSVVAIKLVLHPALVFGAALLARRMGASLSDLQVAAITLACALPSASNVSILAERHGADSGLVARIILGSTVAAFITFALWAWAFGVDPIAASAG
ncbi:MAG: hypothetical protein RIR43_256 [Pseudomonadota bacterium]|jgi:predicted permease